MDRPGVIPFNRPSVLGGELAYVADAVTRGHLAGHGFYTARCHDFFARRFGFTRSFLTSSCTDALEMAALLAQVGPGDEVILPSYTFVSPANAFALRGASLRFVDSQPDHPNIDPAGIEEAITPRTRALVVMHYAGMACPMDRIMELARRHRLLVIEDAAQAIDACWQGQPLGGIGDFGTLSFHETKNVTSGEGGLLIVNNAAVAPRAEILWEKGTNRAAFQRGEVEKYAWVDLGSSYLASELTAAFLWGQLEHLDTVRQRRQALWEHYQRELADLPSQAGVRLPLVPPGADHNFHTFYLVCPDRAERTRLQEHLASQGIAAPFHYQPLHQSPFFHDRHDGRPLPNAVRFADRLVRLPLFSSMSLSEIDTVIAAVRQFFR
jgi:dTDP-4-amino-4,6-dideoxygalactose transaminase